MINEVTRLLSLDVLLILCFVTFLVPPEIVNPIVIGLLFVFLIARTIKNKEQLKWSNFNFVSIGFLVLFFIEALTLLYTEDMSRGVQVLGRRITFVVIPFLPLFLRKDEVDLKVVSRSYSNAIVAIFFFLFLSALYRNFSDGYTVNYLLNALFNNPVETREFKYFNYWEFIYDKFCQPLSIQPIYLGLFANIGLVLTLSFKIRQSNLVDIVKVIFLALTVLLSGSRWQFLICLCILGYFLFFVSSRLLVTKLLIIGLIISFSATIVLYNPVLNTRFREAFNLNEKYYNNQFGGTAIRLKKWSSALLVIEKKPILGYGIGDASEILRNQYKKDKFYLGYYYKFNAHNQYLDTLISSGLFGLCALIFVFYKSLSNFRTDKATALIALIYLLSFLTESMLYRQWGVISFVLFLVVFSNFYDDKKTSVKTS